MGTPTLLTTLRRPLPLMVAIALGLLMTAWVAGTARAGGNCSITVEPDTVPVGGQFVVSGNFGAGAEVHLVRGTSGSFPEDSEPVYTSPQNRSNFKATITMGPGTEGVWTVWGLIFATECGDSAQVTVTAVPDTAVGGSDWSLSTAVGALLLALAIASVARRQSIQAHTTLRPAARRRVHLPATPVTAGCRTRESGASRPPDPST